jgi:8-oxo-dGTP pyrophosphatase MutT (NUDIX family)
MRKYRLVPVTSEAGVDLAVALYSPKLSGWVDRLHGEFGVQRIHVQSVDMFGSTMVGFVKVRADLLNKANEPFSRVVLLSGGSVSILFVLICEGEMYAVLTSQLRLAAADLAFLEVIAGRLDDSGNIVAVALHEMEEEAGIVVKPEEMVLLNPLTPDGVLISPGVLDESVAMFSVTRTVDRDMLNSLQGKLTGLKKEHEEITLRLVPFTDDVMLSIPDAKTQLSYLLYQRKQRLGQ